MRILGLIAVASALCLVPAAAWWSSGGCALGARSYDLVGHLWMAWNASQGEATRTVLQGWPEGVDLLPVLGGWADVHLGGIGIAAGLAVEQAYTLVICGYLLVAGVGGYVLARTLGASAPGGTVAGLVLQLDPGLGQQVVGGRPEQVGLGVVALALAGALGCVRSERRWVPFATGVAWAAVVWVSWEYALMVGAALALLAPFALRGPRVPGVWRRWALALGVSFVFAGPHVLAFLQRAFSVRDVAEVESAFALDVAIGASVGLLGWLGPGQPRPAWAALLCVLALPWLVRDRPLRRGILLVLVLALLFALGPRPGVWRVGPPGEPWGPFHALQQLPLLGWFHWPSRLLVAWSVVAAVAAGLVASRGRWGAGLGAAIVLGAAAEARTLPVDRTTCVPPHPHLEELAEAPRGGLLELPLATGVNPMTVAMLERQLRHGQPLMTNGFQAHLLGADGDAAAPWLAWASGLSHHRREQRELPPPTDLASALPDEVRYIVLLDKGMSPKSWARTREALSDAFGAPRWRVGRQWICWDRG